MRRGRFGRTCEGAISWTVGGWHTGEHAGLRHLNLCGMTPTQGAEREALVAPAHRCGGGRSRFCVAGVADHLSAIGHMASEADREVTEADRKATALAAGATNMVT